MLRIEDYYVLKTANYVGSLGHQEAYLFKAVMALDTEPDKAIQAVHFQALFLGHNPRPSICKMFSKALYHALSRP